MRRRTIIDVAHDYSQYKTKVYVLEHLQVLENELQEAQTQMQYKIVMRALLDAIICLKNSIADQVSVASVMLKICEIIVQTTPNNMERFYFFAEIWDVMCYILVLRSLDVCFVALVDPFVIHCILDAALMGDIQSQLWRNCCRLLCNYCQEPQAILQFRVNDMRAKIVAYCSRYATDIRQGKILQLTVSTAAFLKLCAMAGLEVYGLTQVDLFQECALPHLVDIYCISEKLAPVELLCKASPEMLRRLDEYGCIPKNPCEVDDESNGN